MSSDDGGESRPPTGVEPSGLPRWDWDHPLSDPTPTGEITIVPQHPVPQPETAGEPPARAQPGRRRPQPWTVTLAALAPVAGVIVAIVLLRSAWSGGGSDGSSSAPPNTEAPPLAIVTVPVAGDPLEAAGGLVIQFVGSLAAGDIAAAAAMTDGVRTENWIGDHYDIEGVEARVVATDPSSRNSYTLRVLVIDPADDAGDRPTFRCERWAVNPSATQVIPGDRATPIDDPSLETATSAEALLAAATDACRHAQLR